VSPTVEVEVRRNRHGSVLAYADRDRAARLLDDHRAVLQALYDLVDRRHGSDGETVARLGVREDSRVVDELDLRDRFRRDLEADRAISLVEDLRYHAGERELVTDGGVDRDPSSECDDRGGCSDEKGDIHANAPLTRCAECTRSTEGVDAEILTAESRRLRTDGGRDRSENDLARVADALELQNALLLQLVQEREHERDHEHPDPDRTGRSDRATATAVVDAYGDLYGGSVAEWEFDPVSDRTENMGDSQ